MAKQKIGKIKVDFLNSRIEFSPNINILSKTSQSITGSGDIEEVIIGIEIPTEKMDPPKYKSYELGSDSIVDDEPFDLDDPWYKQESAPVTGTQISSRPAPPPTATTPSIPGPSAAASQEIQQLEAQIESINKMIESLDQNFGAGGISQEEFLKKKNFLGEKMGALMGKLDSIRT